MRALMSIKPGPPETLQLVDVPAPSPQGQQVLIQIKACGVNYPDFLTIQDLYQVKTPRPFAPGAEVAGIVASVGERVTGFRVGQRVSARIGTGGMAEFVAVDQDRCNLIPDGMSFVDAAVMQFTFETAYYALRDRANLQSGETVLVLGAAGGIGTAAIQVARNLQARVIAAASSEAKLAFARENGAHGVFQYPTTAPAELRTFVSDLKRVVGADGAHVVIDPVGGWLSEPAMRCLAEGGRYLVLGFTAGIPSLPLNLPLLKNADVLGINWRTFTLRQNERNASNRNALQRWYEKGLLTSGVSAEFPLHDGSKAIQLIADRSAVGKVVVTV